MREKYRVDILHDRQLAKPFILERHYAKRMPGGTMFCFGMWDGDELIGVATFGNGHSRLSLAAIAGDANVPLVLVLSRLVLKYNRKNEASMLISGALKLLPRPRIIVSYADAGQGHCGFVYQATNWLYTGTSKKGSHTAAKGGHPRTASGLREKLRAEGKLVKVVTTPKHRYIKLLGSKSEIKQLRKSIKIPVYGRYPKLDGSGWERSK